MSTRAKMPAAGSPAFRSLLYREPWLYDLAFPDSDKSAERMLLSAIGRLLPEMPQSVLDLGCGTGQHLEALARIVPECHGIDLLESNINFARSVRLAISFHVGDMRTIRLGRKFDLVICLGNALSYALTDHDLAATLGTFAAHANVGTLLAVDVLNARAYLEGSGFKERIEGHVATPQFTATSVSLHELDRQARVLKRTRTWRIVGRRDVQDYAEYRLLFPEEVKGMLDTEGFRVLGIYDNREFKPTDLTGKFTAAPDIAGMRGRKLYVFACKL